MLLGLLPAAFLLNQDRECEEQHGYFYMQRAKELYKNSALNLVCVALLLKRLIFFPLIFLSNKMVWSSGN